jgi:lambda family phage portal protein
MSIRDWFRRKPAAPAARSYDGARASRLNSEFGVMTSSADYELAMHLSGLRNRSRALVRNNAYAKRARVLMQNNVVGSGIGLQAQVAYSNGKLREPVNSDIETAWAEWCRADSCHVAGRLHFADIEAMLIGEVFEAGEVLVRMHDMPFGNSRVPLALEIIEAERLADDTDGPTPAPGNVVRLGVEQDRWGRPVAYWLRTIHPGDRSRMDWAAVDRLERVPAAQVLHLYVATRWPQTRGEPWMHAAIRKLQDIAGYTESELVAARAAAAYMGFVKSPETTLGEPQADGSMQWEVEPGIVRHLAPGEEFEAWNPNRPNSQAEPFVRLMLREVAGAIGVSYESLSRDYSQSNYSSSRLALLDDRDIWRGLQRWFIRAFREPLHRRWLEAAATFGALPAAHMELLRREPLRYAAVAFKPRGWSWVDPTKEVNAYKEAERAGYITKADIIAATAGGADIEDVLKARRRELDLIEELGLEFDTDGPEEAPEPAQTQTPTKPEPDDDDEAAARPLRAVR